MAHPLAPKTPPPPDPRRYLSIRPAAPAGDQALARLSAFEFAKFEAARGGRKLVRPIVLQAGGAADWKLILPGASNHGANPNPFTLWADPTDHTKTFLDGPVTEGVNIFVGADMPAAFVIQLSDPGPISFDAKLEILDNAGVAQIVYQYHSSQDTELFPVGWFGTGSPPRWGPGAHYNFTYTPPDGAHLTSPTWSGVRASVFNIVGDGSTWGCGISGQVSYFTAGWKIISV